MDELEKSASLALAEARAYVRLKAVYFSSTIYNLRPVWVRGLKTLGVTDQLVCVIDPEWYLSLPSVKMRASCLVHEAHHILRGLWRLNALPDHKRANDAGDLAINSNMDDERDSKGGTVWELPDWALRPEKFKFDRGLALEQYYDLLSKLPAEPSDSCSGNSTDTDDRKPYRRGDVEIQNRIFAGGCGSCGGDQLSKELENKVNKEYGRSQPEVNQVIKDGIREIQSYARGERGRGNLPGGLEDLLDWSDTPPVVPWTEQLRHVIRRTSGRIVAGCADFSMKRIAKRSYVIGLPRPGIISKKINLCIIEDTSESMGEHQLKVGRSEACNAIVQLGVDRAWYMDADAAVAGEPKLVSVQNIVNLPILGRGGTNFGPALEKAKRLSPRPDIVIYFTDGDGYAPAQAPTEFEVIWCIVPSPWQTLPADWGTTIIMSDDGEIRNSYEFHQLTTKVATY